MDEELYKMLQARHVEHKNKITELYADGIKLLDNVEQQLKSLFESNLSTADIVSDLSLTEEIIEVMKRGNTLVEFVEQDMKRIPSFEEFKERLEVNYKGNNHESNK